MREAPIRHEKSRDNLNPSWSVWPLGFWAFGFLRFNFPDMGLRVSALLQGERVSLQEDID